MAHETHSSHDGTHARNWASAAEAPKLQLTTLGPLLQRRVRVDAPCSAFVQAVRVRLPAAGPGGPASENMGRLITLVGQVRGRSPRGLGAAPRRHGAIAAAGALLAVLALGAVVLGRLDLALVLLITVVLAVLIVTLIADRRWRP